MRFLPLAIIGAALVSSLPCLAQEATDTGLSGAGSTSGGSTAGGSGAATDTTTSISTSSNSGPALSGGAQTTGTGLYSKLPFELNFSLNEGYDDNANNVSGSKQGSGFTNTAFDLAYDFGDPRVQLSLAGGVGFTYFYEAVAIQDYDIDLHGSLSILYKVNPRLNLRSKLNLAYQTEPNFSFGYGVTRRSGNYFFTTDNITAEFEWVPRFSTATTYNITALNYDDRSVGESEDRIENTIGNEFRFQLIPTTMLIAEYRYQIITYSYIDRDSTTHYLLGGIDHHFSPLLQGSLRVGAEFRDYDMGPDRSEPYVEGTVSYASGKRSSISWNVRYGLEEPDFIQIPSRKTFRTGLQVKQELMPRLSAQFTFYYQHDDNQSFSSPSLTIPAFSEDAFDIGISGRYMVTHYLAIQAGYNHTEVTSDIPFREYDRNRVYGGVNIAF